MSAIGPDPHRSLPGLIASIDDIPALLNFLVHIASHTHTRTYPPHDLLADSMSVCSSPPL